MSQEYKEIMVESDEITLKDLILKIKDFWKAIIKNIWIVLLFALLVGAIMFAKAWLSDVQYVADMTFTIANTEKGDGGASSVSGLLGQIGLGGVAGSSGLNIYRVIALAKSREIIESVLFEKVELDGKEDYIANHIMDTYKLQEEWGEDNEKMLDFTFLHSKIDSFTRAENKALKKLHKKMLGDEDGPPILKISFEEESKIFSMSMTTISEDLSLSLLENEYNILSEYYIERTIEPQQRRYNNIKFRMDSITKVLEQLDYSVAKYADRSFGLPDQTSTVQGKRLDRDRQLASITYAEIKKNLEIADFSLNSVTPIFQSIDEAILPLSRLRQSIVLNIIIGIILGSFIGILFIIIRKIFSDALAE